MQEERCCKNCHFYENGICRDFDGLYFGDKKEPYQRCPDFQTSEEVRKYGIRFLQKNDIAYE